MSDSQKCSADLSETIESFRLGREGQGSASLTKIIDFLTPRLERYATQLTQDDMVLLRDIIAGQERGDYLFVADILEYLVSNSTLGKIIYEQ